MGFAVEVRQEDAIPALSVEVEKLGNRSLVFVHRLTLVRSEQWKNEAYDRCRTTLSGEPSP